MTDKPLLLDVRTPLEYASGHIPNAVNIPVDDLRSRLAELLENPSSYQDVLDDFSDYLHRLTQTYQTTTPGT